MTSNSADSIPLTNHTASQVSAENTVIDTPKQHLHTLDLLRGIAALSVVLYHYSGTGLAKLINEPTKSLFSWGYLGVEIFFVISGFIIPFSLNRSKYSTSDFFSYISKRLVRIIPPAYVILTLTILQFYVIDKLHLSTNKWFENLTGIQIINNYLLTADLFKQPWLNGVFWTLAIELQFYVLLGLLYNFLFKNIYLFTIISFAFSLLFYAAPIELVWYFKYNTLFAIGGLTFLYHSNKTTQSYYFILLTIFSVICFFQLGLLPTIFGTATSLIIIYIQIKSKIGIYLGKISYSLYLIHILSGSTLEKILINILPHNEVYQKIILIGIITLAAIGAADLYYRTVEKYFLMLSGKLFKKR